MFKLLEGKKRDPKQIHEALQKGFGVKHPENVAGYANFFYELGDVYVTDGIYQRMKGVSEFHDFVMQSIQRFEKADYGEISDSDYYENMDNRWMFGIPRQYGRYGFRWIKSFDNTMRFQENIKIRKWGRNTYVMYESELDTEADLLSQEK